SAGSGRRACTVREPRVEQAAVDVEHADLLAGLWPIAQFGRCHGKAARGGIDDMGGHADTASTRSRQREERRVMTAAPPQSQVTEGVWSLEVRWIFPGELAGVVAAWFACFPAETTVLEDVYLLDPHLPGLSGKVRDSRALEVKAYRGNPGLLAV